jgi:hypothetical protein
LVLLVALLLLLLILLVVLQDLAPMLLLLLLLLLCRVLLTPMVLLLLLCRVLFTPRREWKVLLETMHMRWQSAGVVHPEQWVYNDLEAGALHGKLL